MEDRIDIEITVSEGGTWLRMPIDPALLCTWLSIPYSMPRLDEYVSVYALRLNAGGTTIIRDYATANNTWRVE